MSNVWFTSDTHFSHKLVSQIRGFVANDEVDVNRHDETIIRNWNGVVRPDDIVYLLGDVSLKSPRVYAPLTVRLNGTIHLVYGNHDPGFGGIRGGEKLTREYLDAGFASMHEFLRKKIDGRNVLMSHFPYSGDRGDDRATQYRLRNEGVPILHGHTHQNEVISRDNGTLQIHVGLDAWGLFPVNIDDIVEILRQEA